MTRESQPRISRKLLVLFMPVAFSLASVGATPVAAAPPAKQALINAATVVGSPSQEEAIALAAGFAVTVVSDAQWSTMTAAQFAGYDLLIAGDPNCGSLAPGLISSASTYGPVVLGNAGGRTSAGNRIVVGTDPVFHDGGDYTSTDARGTIIRKGIAFAGSRPGTTGMYLDTTCGANYHGQAAETLAVVDALSAGSGAWTIDATPPCGTSVSLIASNPAFAGLTTASLAGWGCSVHESFPTFRADWSALAVATDSTLPQNTCGVDPSTGSSACGEAYILIAGANIVVSSQGISITPLDVTNPAGTSHTVTANVHDTGGPLNGKLVIFSVTGQNAGASGSCAPNTDCTSGADGNVSFMYTDTNGAGDDTIKASFTDDTGSLQTATAQKHWISAPPARLTLTKVVVNAGGGTTAATAWTLSATSTTGPTSISGSGGVSADVPAGTYTLAESDGPTSGYSAGSWSCTPAGLLTGNSLVLAPGATASCSITNTFNASTNTSTTVTCPPTQSCTTAPITSPGGTVVTITGTGGATIVAEFDPFSTGLFVPCKDQKPRDPNNILSFDSDTGTKTIQMTVSGKGPVPICWNSLTKFKQRDGHDAHFNSALHVYYGLLPDCKGKHPVAPCVLSTVTSPPPPHHDEHHHPKPPPPPPPTTTVRILAPAGDPKLRA